MNSLLGALPLIEVLILANPAVHRPSKSPLRAETIPSISVSACKIFVKGITIPAAFTGFVFPNHIQPLVATPQVVYDCPLNSKGKPMLCCGKKSSSVGDTELGSFMSAEPLARIKTS